jgi:protein-disulfide isomerase
MSKLTRAIDASDHVRGPATARVTLVEYGDFQCPYCKQAFPIVEKVLADFGNELRFAFRNFPLTEIHPLAEQAAEAAEAAGAQGRFWEMHHLLYQHQPRFAVEELLAYGTELGLDTGRMARELAERRYLESIQRQALEGVRSGVNGTPTFFINGRRHDAAWDYDDLASAIEQAGETSGQHAGRIGR